MGKLDKVMGRVIAVIIGLAIVYGMVSCLSGGDDKGKTAASKPAASSTTSTSSAAKPKASPTPKVSLAATRWAAVKKEFPESGWVKKGLITKVEDMGGGMIRVFVDQPELSKLELFGVANLFYTVAPDDTSLSIVVVQDSQGLDHNQFRRNFDVKQ